MGCARKNCAFTLFIPNNICKFVFDKFCLLKILFKIRTTINNIILFYMSTKLKIILLSLAVIGVIVAGVLLITIETDSVPYNTDHLKEFHTLTTEKEVVNLHRDNLSLFVDYSNCIADGMKSAFYQKMVSPLTAATKEYWSIKGSDINKEEGNVYELLNNIQEVNYAALDSAINQMAELEGESILLTDGELFSQTATKANPNNPYMHAAYKKWLLKGHDIHIIAEPYQEVYKGKSFNKKRFYIIFTDDRIEGNIYSRITEVVNLEEFPEVEEFHLSGNYPWTLATNGKTSVPNEILAATPEGYGTMEIQDWQVDWKNILKVILNGVDQQGNPLPNGEKLIGGLNINKNAFGCYRIKDIDVKVYNINNEYFDIYNRLEEGEKVGFTQIDPMEIPNFIIADSNEFKKHGNVDLYFDIEKFAPNGELTGKPFNYFKIEIKVKDLENILGDNIDLFNFDSIDQDGKTNESISASLTNCLSDNDILRQLKGTTLYTIYVKSNKY